MYQHKQPKEPITLKHLIDERLKICFSDKKFSLIENVLDKEIQRLRGICEHGERHVPIGRGGESAPKKDNMLLPGKGPIISISQRLYFAVDHYPTYNFTGRIIGPKGQNLKDLEKMTACRIHIRGRGSTRMKIKHEQEHNQVDANSNEPLNVIIYAEDFESRVYEKMRRAIEVIKPFLVPIGTDNNLIDIQSQLVRESHYYGYRSIDMSPVLPRRGLKRTKHSFKTCEKNKRI